MNYRPYFLLFLILFVSCSKDTTTIIAQSSIAGSTSLVPTTNKGYLIQHTYFTLSYSETNRQAEWVAYNLNPSFINGTQSRTDDFRIDPKVKNNPVGSLVEIHGNINYKRRINAEHIEELELADWQSVTEHNLKMDLFGLFNITEGGKINEETSYRPHILLFDEYYTELYQYENAITWILSADTIIFMGTSNSVGFTSGALQIGVSKGKKVIVVDPNPSPSFNHPEVDLIKMTASDFCKMYF